MEQKIWPQIVECYNYCLGMCGWDKGLWEVLPSKTKAKAMAFFLVKFG